MTALCVSGSECNEVLDLASLRWTEEHAPCGVFTSDLASRICGWNQWMERHTGRPASEVIGRKLVEAFPELLERGLVRYFEEALLGQVGVVSQRLHGFLLRMATDSGGGGFECMQQSAQIAPLLHEGEVVGVIGMITDVTDRVAREAELHAELSTRAQRLVDERAARAEADASNRTKDEFLAILSHELRTPMHAILGWAQVLRDGNVAPERMSHGIAAIERNAQIQTQLIEDLLDVSRIVSGNLRIDLRPVGLRRAIDAAVELIDPTAAAKGVRLAISVDDLEPVLGDEARLQQVIWNLLGNGVKFTPTGGLVSLHASSSGGTVSLIVRDTGAGITPAFLPHVFDRFSQSDSSTTRAQGGLGLGLSIVKRLVELHGGTVTAASEGEGLGASFVVTLPSAGGVLPEPAMLPLPQGGALDDTVSQAGRLAGVRILFVDDDADGREIMALALTMEGAEVVLAESAARARTALSCGVPDVLVSDIGMPGEDGCALLRSIRGTMPHAAQMPAIALTGFAGLDDKRRAREAGFDAYLTKPVELDVLIAKVIKVIRVIKVNHRLAEA